MSASFLLRHKQFFINLISSSGLLTLGDYIAQTIYEKKKNPDTKRLCMLFILFWFFFVQIIDFLAAACVTGLAMGVEGHVWYSFLDRIIPRATWSNVFKKVFLDQTIAVPIYTVTYIVGKMKFG